MNMRNAIGLVAWLAVSGSVVAQQAPSGQTPPTATPPTADKPFYPADVGDTTRYVLQLQASGAQAGKPLPMLGDEATASYRRYLKSFEHPIPEFYETTLSKTDEGGR
jgi:hypothetical protein